ncbi:pyridoxine/pyridoxamine 5'-phosphate oxidase 2 isoform X2 [Triticum aestivum]|uniref:pyridoxine/pyridoxamine 5'-phosphate oxidase 2 isoform X2 n=1 Tax=Triticum aestivum TaxID=4565 RepID=UPI001ABD061D|nr:pyridoxine/pyridoxamine 5'-phosphate oxidase 2 isoform X2 [Aegilops tauschii subsp. strangulata]XP_044377137.1 pyridoxine/pyridoxamine 5'-phosphate oxidase 2-like isoform X2 [Triticum aestivum]
MAGGGAAASALSSPWRALLQRALDANAHLKHSTFFQLATVGAAGRPANRTVVFRGFQEQCDKIQINTDARSNKIGEIREWPLGEICWYFTDSWEQFRISGIIDVIDGSSLDPAKLQQREKAWFASSVKSRSQYLGQSPGVPVANDDHIKDVHIDPSAGPVDAYCLLTLDPEKIHMPLLCCSILLVFIFRLIM